mmetsp:Transcript_14732/g.37778  ORF Transcript_14732/g.37778 Transcript_14732/m.37778 type:complete len:207 (+) Transcript_14732:402-1022(+)
MLGALDSAELDPRVVRAAHSLHPLVPLEAPQAARLQLLRQAFAAPLGVAPSIADPAIKVIDRCVRELCGASVGEDPLAGAGNLDVKAVVAGDVVADVRDLDDHRPAGQPRVRAAPLVAASLMVPGREEELKALAAVGVACQATRAAHGSGSKAHTEPLVEHPGLVVRAAGRAAALADGLLVRVFETLARLCVARHHGTPEVALALP